MADFSFDSPEQQEKFSEFPPLFKKCLVGREQVLPDLREYLEKNNLVRTPVMQLISSFHAEQSLVSTELCCLYMKLGCSIRYGRYWWRYLWVEFLFLEMSQE